MSNIYTGKATVRGFEGTISGTGVPGAASLKQVSGSLKSDRPFDWLRDNLNQVVGGVAADGLYLFDVTWEVLAAASATVTTALAEPTPFAQVTLSGFRASGVAGATLNHARWVVVPNTWEEAFSRDGNGTYKFQIACSTNAAVDLTSAAS